MQSLKEKLNFWMHSDVILEHSTSANAKVLTLIVLEESIRVGFVI